RAATLGLVTLGPSARVCFVHERIRNAALACLSRDEYLDAHARAAARLTGPEPDRMLRRVQHAFAAAQRSTTDAATAVQLAREAARTLQGIDGFEPAAEILKQAVELHDTWALTEPTAELSVELGEAVLSCG